jgi:hypothetical protein
MGARSFEESEAHTREPQALSLIKSNKLGCTSTGCHNIVHNINLLKEATIWKEPAK